MKNLIYLHFITLFIVLSFQSCKDASSDPTPGSADHVAISIEKAINKSAWDKTKWVHWVFGGRREHLWDRSRGFSEVKWDDYRGVINVNTQQGIVYENDVKVVGSAQDSLLQKAWSIFINDAFWLNAPAKLFDEGTQRSIVDREGKTCLKVEYTSGGVTPGDYYVWHYDESYLPTAYEMYVSVIPTPGVLSSWENWITLDSGARIAIHHRRGDNLLEMKEVKSGNSYRDFGRSEDPFAGL